MGDLTVRSLGRADADAMRRVDAACPLVADWTLQLDRGPDFFRWSDEVFDAARYVGAEVDGALVGFAMVARADDWFYCGDARVLPAFRGRGVARAIAAAVEPLVWPDLDDGMGIVKLGNRPAERFAAWLAGRDRFVVRPAGTLEVVAIPALRVIDADPSVVVRPMGAGDVEEVVTMTRRVLAGRVFAPRLHPDAMGEGWLVARRGGRVVGAMQVVDLAGVHGMRVLRYSAAGWALRAGLALCSRLRPGVRPPPRRGEPVLALTTSHVAADDPGTLRALLAAVPRARHHVLEVALVDDDPLRPAVRGLWGVSVTSTILSIRRAGRPERLGRPYVDLVRL